MRVLITGASSGIGKQIAEDYAADGWEVIACGRNAERLSNPQFAQTLCFDTGSLPETKAAAESLLQGVDVLILNAGTCEYIDDPMQFDATLFTRVFDSNVIGTAHCLEAFLPKLNNKAKVAFTGSASTLLPFSRAEAYGASKAAIAYLANSLRVDLASKNISVSLIQPGFVETPMTAKNTFPMPGMISPEHASKAIRRGIDKRKSTITTPWLFNCILGSIGRLPHPIPHIIATRLKNS